MAFLQRQQDRPSRSQRCPSEPAGTWSDKLGMSALGGPWSYHSGVLSLRSGLLALCRSETRAWLRSSARESSQQ